MTNSCAWLIGQGYGDPCKGSGSTCNDGSCVSNYLSYTIRFSAIGLTGVPRLVVRLSKMAQHAVPAVTSNAAEMQAAHHCKVDSTQVFCYRAGFTYPVQS